MFLLLITFCLAFIAITAQRKTSIVNVKYNFECDEEYIKVYPSHKVTENDYFINITFDVQKPVTSVKIHPRLSLNKDAFDMNYGFNALSTTINVCDKKGFLKTSLMFRSLVNTFAAGLVDSLTCPYNKGKIRFENCRLSSIIFPPMVPDAKFKLWGELTAIPVGSKKVIKLCSANVFAEHKRPT